MKTFFGVIFGLAMITLCCMFPLHMIAIIMLTEAKVGGK